MINTPIVVVLKYKFCPTFNPLSRSNTRLTIDMGKLILFRPGNGLGRADYEWVYTA